MEERLIYVALCLYSINQTGNWVIITDNNHTHTHTHTSQRPTSEYIHTSFISDVQSIRVFINSSK